MTLVMYFFYLIPILSLLDLLDLLAAQSTVVSAVTIMGSQPNVPVCYSPNKDVAINNYACDLSANISVCCGIGSICLDNKICQNGNNELIRGSCTDQTWQSSECPQYCLGASTGGTDLISCQNVTNNNLDYCCDHTTDCCNSGVGRFRLSGIGKPLTTIASSASTATQHLSTSSSAMPATTTSMITSSTLSSSAASLPATMTSASPYATTLPSQGLSTGAKIGVGVGVSAGVIIIAALSTSLWLILRKRTLPDQQTALSGDGKPTPDVYPDLAGTHSQMHEVDGGTAWEMPGDRTEELPTQRHEAWELPSRN